MTVISLMKYLMFVFNGLVFIGGICLLSVGIWVITDPDGVQNIISNPYLNAVAFLVVFVGVALSFLGFLGCYGAISQNREMLLSFFLLVLLAFILEIVAAVLIHIHGQKIRDDFFLMQLKQNYQGDNSSDVFSRTWNTFMIMLPDGAVVNFPTSNIKNVQYMLVHAHLYTQPSTVTCSCGNCLSIRVCSLAATCTRRNGCQIDEIDPEFACCGISGPDDFKDCSYFREKQPDDFWPHACCTQISSEKRAPVLDLKLCKQKDPKFINSQGCFSTIARILQKYVSITEGCCLGVITIEIFAMFFACCLYRYFD